MAETPEPAADPQLDIIVDAIVARRGLALDDDQRTTLRQQVERLRAGVATLDAFPLDNADEPDASFDAVQGVDVP